MQFTAVKWLLVVQLVLQRKRFLLNLNVGGYIFLIIVNKDMSTTTCQQRHILTKPAIQTSFSIFPKTYTTINE